MSVKENLDAVTERIKDASIKAGRNPEDITLIAVSKTKPVELIKEAVAQGVTHFGENRPQEIVEKYSQIDGVKWHLIGQLQKNKVRHIIDKVELIHSVDSLSLAEEIQKRASVIDKVQDILIQVNISGEETKSGVAKEEVINLCRQISCFSHIRIKGLMTISVKDYGENENIALFKELWNISREIEKLNIPNVSMKELSMGMTHDFEEAILAGATMVRIGTAVFGGR